MYHIRSGEYSGKIRVAGFKAFPVLEVQTVFKKFQGYSGSEHDG
jgi:hypothetical protein